MTLSPFVILGDSWLFYRKHSGILNQILLWMLTIPMSLLLVAISLSDEQSLLHQTVFQGVQFTPASLFVISLLAYVLLVLWLFWGSACVLLVGQRIAKSAAGRSRSSLKIVRKQAKGYIVPLFLTDILRDCFTALWSILLVVPGVIYHVRTAIYPVVSVCEGLDYREGLRRSQEIVRGYTGRVLLVWLIVSIVLFLVPTLFLMTIPALLPLAIAAAPLYYLLAGALFSFALLLYLLAITTMYRDLLSLQSSR